jgi:hypothetical protein
MRRLLYLSLLALALAALSAPVASAQIAPATCDKFVSVAGYRSSWEAQQYLDFYATPEESAYLDTDGDGFACDGWSSGVDRIGIQGGESGYWAADGYFYPWS